MFQVDTEEISYGRLFNVSVNLAKQLTQLGLKKGDVISIVSQNNWKYLAATISGFYIGAQINFLNPDYTSGELKHFFVICKPNLIFCSKRSSSNVLSLKEEPFFAKNVVIFDEEKSEKDLISFDSLIRNSNFNFCPVEVEPKKDIAIIPTSSGTTGLPKCVLLTHTNIRVPILHFG